MVRLFSQARYLWVEIIGRTGHPLDAHGFRRKVINRQRTFWLLGLCWNPLASLVQSNFVTVFLYQRFLCDRHLSSNELRRVFCPKRRTKVSSLASCRCSRSRVVLNWQIARARMALNCSIQWRVFAHRTLLEAFLVEEGRFQTLPATFLALRVTNLVLLLTLNINQVFAASWRSDLLWLGVDEALNHVLVRFWYLLA